MITTNLRTKRFRCTIQIFLWRVGDVNDGRVPNCCVSDRTRRVTFFVAFKTSFDAHDGEAYYNAEDHNANNRKHRQHDGLRAEELRRVVNGNLSCFLLHMREANVLDWKVVKKLGSQLAGRRTSRFIVVETFDEISRVVVEERQRLHYRAVADPRIASQFQYSQFLELIVVLRGLFIFLRFRLFVLHNFTKVEHRQ